MDCLQDADLKPIILHPVSAETIKMVKRHSKLVAFALEYVATLGSIPGIPKDFFSYADVFSPSKSNFLQTTIIQSAAKYNGQRLQNDDQIHQILANRKLVQQDTLFLRLGILFLAKNFSLVFGFKLEVF